MKRDSHFTTDHLRDNLKERAVKSVGITTTAQGIKLFIQIGSIAILSRLLDPSDFGLVAMVTIFSGFALQFMEGGLSMATIQRDYITDAQVSNLFWINSALGAGLFIIGILISPLVAELYNEPRVALIMAALSITFLIGGLSVQHDALLRRQMRFKAISLIDIMSMAAGIIAAIVAALSGLKYWALVISPIATITCKTIMRWLSSGWVPSMMSRGSGFRPLLGFGMHLTGANFIGYIANNLTPFTIGYISGAQSLGVLNRANMLASIPSSQILPPVINVVQPTLSRVANDPQRLSYAIKSIMSKLVLGTMFVTSTMAVLADWIIQLILGANWNDAVPILRMLAVFTLVEPIAAFLAVCLVATGNARALLRWKAITLVILIASIGIGSIWGELGVIAAYALSGLLIRLPCFLLYASRFLPVTVGELFKTLIPSAFCSCCTVAALYGLRHFNQIESPALNLVIFVVFSSVIYTAICLVLKPTRREFLEILTLLKPLASRIINFK